MAQSLTVIACHLTGTESAKDLYQIKDQTWIVVDRQNQNGYLVMANLSTQQLQDAHTSSLPLSHFFTDPLRPCPLSLAHLPMSVIELSFDYDILELCPLKPPSDEKKSTLIFIGTVSESVDIQNHQDCVVKCKQFQDQLDPKKTYTILYKNGQLFQCAHVNHIPHDQDSILLLTLELVHQ